MHYVTNRRISMNKKITLIAVMFLMVSIFVVGIRKEQQELYLKAVAEKDPQAKMGLLKEYVQKFGDKEDKWLRFIYLNLSDTAFKLKNFDECIQNGEIALVSGEIDRANKLRVYFSLANSYYATKRDMDKAYQYAQSVIDLSRALIQQTRDTSQDQEQAEQFANNYKSFYIAPTYRLQGLILYFKNKDNPENIKQAAEKAIEAYNEHKADMYFQMAFSLAGNLAQKNQYDAAIAVAEKIIDKQKPKFKEIDFLAKLYSKKKNKEKTLFYYELAYQTKPTASLARKIGQLVHKQDAPKAVQYFADAFVISGMDKETKAYKFLEHLYFNEVAKDKTAEEKEAGFKQVINAAKTRRGISVQEESAPNT
jgi:tetratricopeptide (TPR) repeat protein